MSIADILTKNTLDFISIANNFCITAENATSSEKSTFVDSMLYILPRLYTSISDISIADGDDTVFLDTYIDEDRYNSIKSGIENIIGEDDVYLEVFMEDMKYSDTPISATVSESIADIYQDIYNCIMAVKQSDDAIIKEALYVCKENFEQYWGQTLCNVMRALHNIKYNNGNIDVDSDL